MEKKGITRKKRKSGKKLAWHYYDHKGKQISNLKIIERCNKLVLPPAWAEVWISPDATADLQATGKDVKGRVQYHYHANCPFPAGSPASGTLRKVKDKIYH